MGLYRQDRVKCDFYGKWKLFPGWHLKIHRAVLFTEIDTGMETAHTPSCRKVGKCFQQPLTPCFVCSAYLASCALSEKPNVLMFTKQHGAQFPTTVHKKKRRTYAWIFQITC